MNETSLTPAMRTAPRFVALSAARTIDRPAWIDHEASSLRFLAAWEQLARGAAEDSA